MVGFEGRSVRGMREDWFSGWSGLTGVRSKLSIRTRGRVDLVGRIVPRGWSCDVTKAGRDGRQRGGPKNQFRQRGRSTTINPLYELCLKFKTV